jgi:hypothetical protein
MASESWPELALDDWLDTRETVHMWTQVVGKVQLEMRPFVNQWWAVGFGLTARGLASGLIPLGGRSFQFHFDFLEHVLHIDVSDGTHETITLEPRSVSDFYAAVMDALRKLGIDVAIKPMPSEVPNPTPFPEDTAHDAYDREAVGRWWQVMLSVDRVIQRFRTGYTGKSSPVLFYWGGFDLNHSRFNGKPLPQPPDADPIRGFGENEQNFAVGFWPGAREAPGAALYAYITPAPPGIDRVTVSPVAARYEPTMDEFVLPYGALRELPDPDTAALEFFRSVYEQSAALAGWDRAALEGPVPPGR